MTRPGTRPGLSHCSFVSSHGPPGSSPQMALSNWSFPKFDSNNVYDVGSNFPRAFLCAPGLLFRVLLFFVLILFLVKQIADGMPGPGDNAFRRLAHNAARSGFGVRHIDWVSDGAFDCDRNSALPTADRRHFYQSACH